MFSHPMPLSTTLYLPCEVTEGLCEPLRQYPHVVGSESGSGSRRGADVLGRLWEGMSEQLGCCFDCINAFHSFLNVSA